jgi:hypothetical protein
LLSGVCSVASLLPGGAAPALTAPTNLIPPSLSGTATQGETLTVTSGSWSGNPVPAVSRDWQRDGLSTGQSGPTYTLTAGDVGGTITVVETATNSQGSAQAISNAIGPIASSSTAPSLPILSTIAGYTPGTNPPDWDTEVDNYITYDSGTGSGSSLRIQWRFNGGAWTVEDWQGLSDAALAEGFSWPLLNAADFTSGGLFEVQAEHGMDVGLPTEQLSGWSVEWSDTLDAITGLVPTARFISSQNLNFGAGPATFTGVAIGGASKIAVFVRFAPNGAQSITGITANSGAIAFTKAAGSANTDSAQLWYADVAAGVTNLDLTVTLSGSTQMLAVAIMEIAGAALGAPVGTAFTQKVFKSGAFTAPIDGGLVIPTNGAATFLAMQNHSMTFTGATKDQESAAADSTGQFYALAHTDTTGTVTVSGSNSDFLSIAATWTP